MRLADRMEHVKDKEMLKVMELSETEGVISFAGGFPSPEAYPVEDIRESFLWVLDRDPRGALSYSATGGYGPLRDLLAKRMKRNFALDFTREQVIITNGSQQALDMTGLMLINPGDVILFEAPSYLGALNAFKAYEAEMVAVPTDDDGIQIGPLKAALEKYGERVKLIYVIPDYQNPTGRCWSVERRRAFMETVAAWDLAVLEDAAYSELAFSHQLEPPLLSFDRKGQVIYCGTFSKIFCPGLRIAWVCAAGELIEQYLLLKNNVDLSSSAIIHRQMVHYLEHYDLDGHIRRISALYQQRCRLMVECAGEFFPEEVRFNEPKGGLFVWAALPEGGDSRQLLERAVREKVAFVPGASFYPDGAPGNEFRLNFTNVPEEQIREGMARLGRVMKEG
ncbi:MAG: PLP-dependent aminotransferase family protein, partial [Bacillota bacterium]|nr:PLP-dependent aminotransferase family protein [Bacillota bacterium]